MPTDFYRNRPLSAGFPDLERKGVEFHSDHHAFATDIAEGYYRCLAQLIDIDSGNKKALVVGCGPHPGQLLI